MSDSENLSVVEIHEEEQNVCEDQCVFKKRGLRKLTLSMKRYSRKRAWKRRIALQKTSEPSTAVDQGHSSDDIIYLPLEEERETPNSKEFSEEPTEELVSEMLETAAPEELTSEIPETEELFIERTAMDDTEEQDCVPRGFSIVDLKHIFAEFKKIGDHAKNREDCGIGHMQITGMKRSGLRTTLTVKCDMCQFKGEIHSEPKESKKMETNQSAVAGIILNGGSYTQMEEFFAAMDIPSMSRKEFRKHHDEIVKWLIVAAEEEMVAAAEEEKRLAIERGDIVPGLGIPHIPVVADGSWMKRSYRSGTYDSASGIGVIIGYHTKKVLFTGVRNKVCRICRSAAKRKEQPRQHTCFKNWGTNQASTAMESDAIVEGFKTSVEKRGLVYSTLIADGDSSVYKKIIDADPYRTQIRVNKIECTNHLLRNFCKKMKEIVKKTTPGPLRKIVESSIRRMRADILKAAEYRYSQNVTIAEKIKNLYADIHNVPSHVFGEHADCSKLQYFCDGSKKKDEENIVPKLANMGVYGQIKDILRPLLAHAESLLYNSNNNSVESFNGIIAKYIGGKRVNLSERGSYTGRCAAAVLQYNTKQVLSRLNTAMNNKPPLILRKIENRRQKENKQSAEKVKAKRIAKHVRKQFRLEKDSNYGPNAQKPDMAKNIYELEQTKHMEMLHNWQNRRDAIQKETIGQANNARWLNFKSKLLTASNFGRVCRRRIGTSCANAVKAFAYPRIINAPAVIYGQECEKLAREELSKHIGVNITECGLFIDPSNPFLGASPDGIIDEEGIVEIKCPKTAENLLPEEAIKTVKIIRRIFQDAEGKVMNKNHYYYYQIQGQLHITGRKYCLFCIWTRKGLKYIKIDKDDNFWQNNMEPKLIEFYEKCMLPELIDSRHNRGMPIREPQFIQEETASLERRKRSLSESSTNTGNVRRRTVL